MGPIHPWFTRQWLILVSSVLQPYILDAWVEGVAELITNHYTSFWVWLDARERCQILCRCGAPMSSSELCSYSTQMLFLMQLYGVAEELESPQTPWWTLDVMGAFRLKSSLGVWLSCESLWAAEKYWQATKIVALAAAVANFQVWVSLDHGRRSLVSLEEILANKQLSKLMGSGGRG